ncbi:hypothetical protein ckrop_0676 [Corynebacterium kroppenstedtii DSM 44385]|uniref:Uncharacterized protein n=2 Tax=Corynebacterium kroppenstedtii TaxID=161879 RepID=C4LHY2_CORK4|nr:hypothetical protein ckrop_0676 [Corynebacterium kroppenstedtii DSM 44385]
MNHEPGRRLENSTSGTDGEWGSFYPPQNNESKPPKKRNLMPISITVVITVALVIGASIIWVALKNADKNSGQDESVAVASSGTLESQSEAPQHGTANPSSPAASDGDKKASTDRCDESYLRKNISEMTGEHEVVYCSGDWLLFGAPRSDGLNHYHWSNGHWSKYERDGVSGISGYGCYLSSRLDADHVPSEIRSKFTECGPDDTSKSNESSSSSNTDSNGYISSVTVSGRTVRASSPACDGRNIVIKDSIVDTNKDATAGNISRVLVANPGSEFMTPGHCSSLRGQLNGDDIYPVYEDFGSDRSAMCQEAGSRSNWYPRTLNDRGDFSSPC